VLSLMVAGGVALLLAVFLTPVLVRRLRARQIGQHIREDGPESHAAKAGTPTMGGVVIVAAAVLGFVLAHFGTHVAFTRSGALVCFVVVGFGFIGFLDDIMKVRNRRSLGLNKRAKSGLQLAFAIAFAVLAVNWAGTQTTLSFTRYTLPGWQLGSIGWAVLAVLVLVGTSNAVNLTDGLDGLAAGSSTFCFATLAIIGYWQFRHFAIYGIASALDLALASVALAGACIGFLWWNAAPAKIYMGDTGSLAIGAGLGALCLLMNLDLLLIIIGGLFVLETLSVIIQVFSFRVFHRRVFKMAPIHHHFELLGWPETTVIVRFWILAGLFTALGLGFFYADFLRASGVV
jgi:phospho-N-acetylmuramoyl-pentapeptide-transferase